MILELGVAAGLVLLMAASLEAGFRLGRRAAAGGEPAGGGPTGAVLGATLGLLGLLLSFSFGGAAMRFIERQDLVVTEANAIGTAYLRADQLDESSRTALRAALKRYIGHRIQASQRLGLGLALEDQREIARFHEEIWAAASRGVAARPEAMLAVLTPVNELIDLHATRYAAGRKHLPLLVLGLLVACSAISMVGIGYGCGLAGRRSLVMTGALVLLIAAALWITIDLDHPRAGLLRISDGPLLELQASIAP